MTPGEQMAHIIVDLESVNVDEMTETQQTFLMEMVECAKEMQAWFQDLQSRVERIEKELKLS
jgi:hypothetical protein